MKKIFTLILLILILVLSYQIIAAFSQPVEKPNIILLITDDLDIRSIPFMPQLQALVTSRGTTFTNFFVTTSLCCPSRASILRGQCAHNHQVLTNEFPDGGFQKFHDSGLEQSTLATWLQSAGYQTVLIGKYLNEYPGSLPPEYVPPGWNEWYARLNFPCYFNFQLNENGKVVSYGSNPEDYLTDVEARIALDFVRRAASNGKPFFMYLTPDAPHNDCHVQNNQPLPPIPAPRHVNAFADAAAPRVPSFDEADVSDKPEWVRSKRRLSAARITEIDAYYRQRLQSLLAVDELLASLIALLEEKGVMENTYILFTSDNGYHLGEHRLSLHKATPYEESIRVSLIVRGPGVPAGRILEHLTLNIDLAPTLAELAGVPIPDFVDGRSLLSLIHGSQSTTEDWRQAFPVEYWRRSDTSPIPGYQALRTQNFKYIEWSTGELEFYDLRVDPYELESRHNTVEPSLLAQFSSLLNQLSQCAGANCFVQTTEVNEKDSNHLLPKTVTLRQNFPNPFDRSTAIIYYLPRDGKVAVVLYNALGQVVKSLLDEFQSAGWHGLGLSSLGLTPGVYFFRLETSGEVVTQKLVFTK